MKPKSIPNLSPGQMTRTLEKGRLRNISRRTRIWWKYILMATKTRIWEKIMLKKLVSRKKIRINELFIKAYINIVITQGTLMLILMKIIGILNTITGRFMDLRKDKLKNRLMKAITVVITMVCKGRTLEDMSNKMNTEWDFKMMINIKVNINSMTRMNNMRSLMTIRFIL